MFSLMGWEEKNGSEEYKIRIRRLTTNSEQQVQHHRHRPTRRMMEIKLKSIFNSFLCYSTVQKIKKNLQFSSLKCCLLPHRDVLRAHLYCFVRFQFQFSYKYLMRWKEQEQELRSKKFPFPFFFHHFFCAGCKSNFVCARMIEKIIEEETNDESVVTWHENSELSFFSQLFLFSIYVNRIFDETEQRDGNFVREISKLFEICFNTFSSVTLFTINYETTTTDGSSITSSWLVSKIKIWQVEKPENSTILFICLFWVNSPIDNQLHSSCSFCKTTNIYLPIKISKKSNKNSRLTQVHCS